MPFSRINSPLSIVVDGEETPWMVGSHRCRSLFAERVNWGLSRQIRDEEGNEGRFVDAVALRHVGPRMELRNKRGTKRKENEQVDGSERRTERKQGASETVGEMDTKARMWKQLMGAGFNVLLHGVGSKEHVIERFVKTVVDAGVVVVRGYAATPTNPKHILAAVYAALKGSNLETKRNLSMESMVDAIDEMVGARVLLVVHSLDGNAVRGREAQTVLSRLAQCKTVHLLASVDHVNCPILWDKRMASAFNWVWDHVPTWQPHVVEKEFLPPLLSNSANETAIQGATLVLKSLTSNTRGVFRVLAEHQLSMQGNVQGLRLMQFYSLCREQFLVSSELTLRTHLTEFKDHELVRTKRGGDGQEYIYIPFSKEKIERMLQEMP